MMSVKTLAKKGMLAAVSAVTGRHAVLLPREAADEGRILSLSAPYRVEGDSLRVELTEPTGGELRLTLLGYQGHFPSRHLWETRSRYVAPCPLSLDLRSGEVALGGAKLGMVPLPLPTRRFCWRIELETDGGTKERLTGHYLATNGNGSYYEGDNYVDYEAEASGDVPRVLDLVEKYGAKGPLLEIGCATGLMLEALTKRGIECYGVDSSAWAVERARERVGTDRVFSCDIEENGLPSALHAKRPFGTILLWAVLEHFRDPFGVVEKLTACARIGAVLLINTTNALSLNRFLFENAWEGYFDTSHHGVDRVSVDSLRRELPQFGWRVENLETHLSWDTNADPTHAVLREWWAADARFRRLLTELDRGDLVTCVAVKTV